MSKRLSDTRAIVEKMAPRPALCEALPDASRAITAKEKIRGVRQYAYGTEEGDFTEAKPRMGVGGEGLRSAVMVLKEGKVGK